MRQHRLLSDLAARRPQRRRDAVSHLERAVALQRDRFISGGRGVVSPAGDAERAEHPATGLRRDIGRGWRHGLHEAPVASAVFAEGAAEIFVLQTDRHDDGG